MKGRPRGTKTSKNLIVRGDVYYFQKMIKGKRYTVSTEITASGAGEFAMAEKRARQIELEIHEGRFGLKPKVKAESTVGAWWDKYVKAHQSSVAATTYLNLLNAKRLITETVVDGKTWADLNMRTIGETDCRAMLTTLQFKCLKSPNSRRTFHSIAASVFERAVSEHLIEENPWTKFKRTTAVPRERVVTLDEQRAVWAHLQPYYQRVMTLELQAGLRVGCELARLKEADVDFVRRQIFVRRGKSSKQRIVPLTTKCAVAVREQLDQNASGNPGVERGSPQVRRKLDDKIIFPVSPRMVLREWHLAARAATVALFTSHDLRRTYGTRCAERGVPMKKLQAWMGHSDISITARFYVHLGTQSDSQLVEDVFADEGVVTTGVITPMRQAQES